MSLPETTSQLSFNAFNKNIAVSPTCKYTQTHAHTTPHQRTIHEKKLSQRLNPLGIMEPVPEGESKKEKITGSYNSALCEASVVSAASGQGCSHLQAQLMQAPLPSSLMWLLAGLASLPHGWPIGCPGVFTTRPLAPPLRRAGCLASPASPSQSKGFRRESEKERLRPLETEAGLTF